MERAKEYNQKASGSGALTRCTPIAALAAACKAPLAAVALAREDAQLSHPSTPVTYASAAYALTAASLIAGSGDPRSALDELRAWLNREQAAVRPGGQQTLGDGKASSWTHLSRGAQ